jgi:NitT/TauT family transport system substrate-binding protein
MKVMRVASLAAAAIACLFVSRPAEAADAIRIAIQKTGTLAWEIAVMKARGLDKAADLDIETAELASTEAGKIALRGGAADVIVTDWLWVQRERSLGDKLLFAPYSTALGAVMVEKDSPIHSVADLAGRSIGVAGGPLDKSWLMLRAAARREGVDLAASAEIAYGAPPLIYEMLRQGGVESALEFWNFSADMETHGLRRAIDMVDVEKALGVAAPVAMTGYVFSESFAKAHADALRRFFDAAAKAR